MRKEGGTEKEKERGLKRWKKAMEERTVTRKKQKRN
jgi:hypothetical protein